MGINGILKVPVPANEPVKGYTSTNPEGIALQEQIRRMRGEQLEIPLIIGGKEIRTGTLGEARSPHDHRRVLARYHMAGPVEVELADRVAREAWGSWSRLDARARAAIFLRMGSLLSGHYRPVVNGATMLGQSKTSHQAEIDAACELSDYFRFNTYFMQVLYQDQPPSIPGEWNLLDYRPLEGVVFAVTPFNFTAIAGNLPTAPALMGNTVLWKPASTAVYSGYYLMKLYKEAGLPDGVINFLPGSGGSVGDAVLGLPSLAGIHFTGSTAVFNRMWRTVGQNLERYRAYPRIVGETGGKGFVFVHPSADPESVVPNLVRGAFEYQGQKCSAASRAYIPSNLWPQVKIRLQAELAAVRVGDPTDFGSFMGAVIDQAAFGGISGYLDHAKADPDMEIVSGGGYDASEGYFVQPTVVRSQDPRSKLMSEEIFGPVLTVYVYPEQEFDRTLALCDATSPYALTGAIFAQDRYAIEKAMLTLRHAAGNLYINDKPTGAVVGRQPFGGSRASGTNDKAGSMQNLLRWVSTRTIKEHLPECCVRD